MSMLICTVAAMNIMFTTNVAVKQFHKEYKNQKGNSVTLHVDNTYRPTEVDDYAIEDDGKGHRITYPIRCERAY